MKTVLVLLLSLLAVCIPVLAGTAQGKPTVLLIAMGEGYDKGALQVNIDKEAKTTNPVKYYITTVAGTGKVGYSGDGGPALKADLRNPESVRVAPDGSIYFMDVGNTRIRKLYRQ